MKKRIPVILLLLIGAAAAVYFLYFKKADTQTDVLTLYGNVEIRQVDISFQVPGVIQDMFFEEGDTVKKGDLVAALDDKDYQINLLRSQAAVKGQKAALDEANSLIEANTQLYKDDMIPKHQYTSYINSRNGIRAAYDAAIITVHFQENQLAYTKLYAPDDGIISTRIREPGSTVGAGQLIYTITKQNPVWIRAYIAEVNLGDVTLGTKARVITDTVDRTTGQKKEYTGRVGYISPVAEFTPKAVQTEDLRTDLVYRINVYVDESDGFLKQGMPATVKINLVN